MYVVGPGLVSMSPAKSRRRDASAGESHPFNEKTEREIFSKRFGGLGPHLPVEGGRVVWGPFVGGIGWRVACCWLVTPWHTLRPVFSQQRHRRAGGSHRRKRLKPKYSIHG